MIKVRDGYGKLIGSDYNGNIAHVLLSNGGNLQYAVGSTASTLVLRNASGQIESSVASTVAPFVISSTKVNANLNADLLDGFLATGLFQSLTSAADKNLYIKIGNTEKEVPLLYASYLGGVTKEGLFTELSNVNDTTNPNSIKVTIGGTTKYLKVAYSDLAGKVVCSSSTNNVDRPIVVTNTSNGVYYSTKVTLNYSTGNVTAPTFTGALIGNADTATTASKLSTVSKTAWGLTYWTSGGVPTSISGDMTGVGNITISATGNKDYFINFLYNSTPTYSWRLGYLGSGSGNANYFVIDSSKSSGGTWHRVLQLGNETLEAVFTGTVTASKFTGTLTNTLTFSAGAFTAKTYNNSAAVTVNIPTHTSHLTNNSGFLTLHQSLANYVTLNTNLTITGLKTFQSSSDTTGVSLILKNKNWYSNMATAMDFYNGSSYTVPNARIETKMVGNGNAGGTLIFYTLTKHASTNPNPNGLTERLRINDNGLITITGNLTVTGTSDFSAGTVKLDVLNIPTSSGGTTFGPGSNGQVLKSNGTTVYWASDSNSNTWRAIQVNGTQIAGTGTSTYALNFISGTGITVAGTSGSSSSANSITITNAGVRSTTINGNYLRVNTNGTNADLTIPYATTASLLSNTSVSDPSKAASGLYLKWYSLVSQASGYAGTNYGFPVSNNANGILWLGTHSGPYGWQMGFSSNGRIYARYISNNSFSTTANGGSWNRIAWTSDIPAVTNYYWANVKVSATSSTTTTPTFANTVINGTLTMGGTIIAKSGSSTQGIKFENSYLNSISSLLLWQSSEAIRFGSSSWDWNSWAGLKYNHSSKIIYLGLADGTVFNANSGLSGGKLYLPGISNIYTGNGANLVWHAGNDGSGSGLDADLLDGTHKTGLLTALSSSSSTNLSITVGGTTKSITNTYATNITLISCYNGTTNNDLWSTIKTSDYNYIGTATIYEVYNDGGPSTYGEVLDIVSVHVNHWQPLLFFEAGKGGRLYYRNKDYNNNSWGNWRTIAYTSDIPTTMAWGNITGKPSTFTPSSHTHDDRYYTESEADGRFINHTGDTMTGPLTFANGTWNVVGDDAAIGDYNAAGMLGLKSINNNIPGIGFHNSSNTLLGRLQANGSNLLWNDQMLLHSSNWPSYIGVDGYVMRTWTIDATGLDLNTWYPVTMALPTLHWVRIEVKETLQARSKPSWSTHGSGFHVTKIWHSLGYGWGTTQAVSQRFVLQSDYCWCNTDPVRGIGLLSNSSTEYVYVRGGGKYYVSTSHNVVPTLRTSTYTISSQSIGPTTSTPSAITAMYSDKSIHAPHFYESSDATLKTNIETINTSDNIPQLKSFNWKEDGKHSYGLIALELEEMGYTELVEESNGKKTVQYSAALSLIVGKLQVKIKELEKEIEILKNKN